MSDTVITPTIVAHLKPAVVAHINAAFAHLASPAPLPNHATNVALVDDLVSIAVFTARISEEFSRRLVLLSYNHCSWGGFAQRGPDIDVALPVSIKSSPALLETLTGARGQVGPNLDTPVAPDSLTAAIIIAIAILVIGIAVWSEINLQKKQDRLRASVLAQDALYAAEKQREAAERLREEAEQEAVVAAQKALEEAEQKIIARKAFIADRVNVWEVCFLATWAGLVFSRPLQPAMEAICKRVFRAGMTPTDFVDAVRNDDECKMPLNRVFLLDIEEASKARNAFLVEMDNLDAKLKVFLRNLVILTENPDYKAMTEDDAAQAIVRLETWRLPE